MADQNFVWFNEGFLSIVKNTSWSNLNQSQISTLSYLIWSQSKSYKQSNEIDKASVDID